MRLAMLVMVLIVTACVQPAGTTEAANRMPSASAVRTPAPMASPSQPATSQHPSLAFSCRLPVVWSPYQPGAGIPANRWGFVVFPSGKLSVQESVLPEAIPYQLGWPGISYDRAVNRWLPVSRSAVSPDGLSSAYADYDPAGPNDGKAVHANSGRVHVVDVRSGQDRTIFSGSPSFGVVDLEADAVYLTQVGTGYTPTATGLYRLGIAGGSPQLLPGVEGQLDRWGWTPGSAGIWWAVDNTPGTLPGMGPGSELIRYDATTRVVQSWLTVASNNFIEVAGIDASGQPIVVSGPDSTQDPATTKYVTALVTARTQTTSQLWDGPSPPGAPWVTDIHGVWMSGDEAVWLYRPDGTMVRLQVPTGTQNTSSLAVAGSCV